jgi:hypothetical protein
MLYQSAIEIQKQISFIGALLSGFSITFLIGLLQLPFDRNKTVLRWCLGCTCVSACSLLISTITSISGAFWLTERPNLAAADSALSPPELVASYQWSLRSLLIGLSLLLVSIGLSGWLHSKRTGIISTTISLTTLVLIFYFWIYVVRIN